MHPDFVIISLFSIQILANLAIAVWVAHEICFLKIKIQDNKRDIDNLATIVRGNRATLQGQLTRFIMETSAKFRAINQDSNFTYPE